MTKYGRLLVEICFQTELFLEWVSTQCNAPVSFLFVFLKGVNDRHPLTVVGHRFGHCFQIQPLTCLGSALHAMHGLNNKVVEIKSRGRMYDSLRYLF